MKVLCLHCLQACFAFILSLHNERIEKGSVLYTKRVKKLILK